MSRNLALLREYLQCVSSQSKPERWAICRARIEEENRHLRRLLRNGISVYGANTLTGHKDHVSVSDSECLPLQEEILKTHAIGGPPYYSEHTARCIGYAKLYSWSAGMSGVSWDLFQCLGNLLTSRDFYPEIPRDCSYSCGDVIPAAHWAKEIQQQFRQDGNRGFKPGEIMATINGSFIQVGYAASLVRRLETCWTFFIEMSALCYAANCAKGSNPVLAPGRGQAWAEDAVQYIRSFSSNRAAEASAQSPISLRALPQIIETLSVTLEDFFHEIDFNLGQPSGNPLFDKNFRFPLSQASFLAPTLSIKTGALIESLLFVMWSMVGRTNYLLGGFVAGIPRDGSTADSPLGVIQHPKLMAAVVEKSRMANGRGIFASGSQTSYGVEDLWTNGLSTLSHLEDLANDFLHLCSIELSMYKYLADTFSLQFPLESSLLEIADELAISSLGKSDVIQCIERGGLGGLRSLVSGNSRFESGEAS